MRNASRKPFSLACILLAASLCQPPVAAAGVYEDLRSAVENDQTSEIAKLLARGADPNTPDERGNTLLMVAVRHKNAKLVDLLIDAGARLNHAGWNPLLYAATAGHPKIIRLLLDGGAAINSTSENGTTALMMAARGNHTDTIKVLLKNGADPNIRNESGGTALKWAVSREYLNAAELLKSGGAKE